MYRGDRRNKRPRINMLYTRNDGGLAKRKLHTICQIHRRKSDRNQQKRGEFWVQTKTNSKQTYWLVDTGTPRSFMNKETARNLLVKGTMKEKQPKKSIGEFRRFSNNKINTQGTIQMDIQSGPLTAKTV